MAKKLMSGNEAIAQGAWEAGVSFAAGYPGTPSTEVLETFATYERVEEIMPLFVKKDGSREPYDRQKVVAGLKKACEKRPISAQTIEEVADGIETEIQERGTKEIESNIVGEAVMNALRDLDGVAYVRFASVYREFRDLDEFMETLRDLLKR